MKRHYIVPFLLLSVFLFSCNEKKRKGIFSGDVKLEPEINIKALESDFTKWWTYHYYNISLFSDFTGLDENSEELNKKEFLEKLTSGEFIALKLQTKHEAQWYKLHRLDALAVNDIGITIKNESLISLMHFNMEGTEFPQFDFTDLNGNHHNNKNTKGKIIVFKTWFINCKACVAEFPELNEWVGKYKERNDVIFLSLALDSKPELEFFLKKKHFKYQVVANQRELIEEVLSLQVYPTHLLVDKSGTIQKVVNSGSEMILFIENEGKFDGNILQSPE